MLPRIDYIDECILGDTRNLSIKYVRVVRNIGQIIAGMFSKRDRTARSDYESFAISFACVKNRRNLEAYIHRTQRWRYTRGHKRERDNYVSVHQQLNNRPTIMSILDLDLILDPRANHMLLVIIDNIHFIIQDYKHFSDDEDISCLKK